MEAPSGWARAPQVFQNPYYESPVQAGPDDLIFLGGLGFESGDRVVYRAAGGRDSAAHPAEVPTLSTSESGTARVLRMDDPAYALTINLPEQIDAHRSYRLWVVNAAGEWSNSFSINDPRPLWFSPAFAFTSAQFAGLKRQLRIIGRNLAVHSGAVRVRLRGPREYLLHATNASAAQTDPQNRLSGLREFVIEADLPGRLSVGVYSVSIDLDDSGWIEVPQQKLQILDNPASIPSFDLGDARFGGCRPDDGQDDRDCLAKALGAAHRAGGGIVEVSRGTWDVFPSSTPAEFDSELVMGPRVQLRGAGPESTQILWRDSPRSPDMGALLLLEGNNSVSGLQFQDQRRFDARGRSRPVIQLGHDWRDPRVRGGQLPNVVRDIVITGNRFGHVGEAIANASLPIERLFVTRNFFSAYAADIEMPGSFLTFENPFRVDDSVIRWNTFVPGDYVDPKVRQGVLATELGASHRLDFSSNLADGSSRAGLQDLEKQPGWRAGFFWDVANNIEQMLLADNVIRCPGDKSGDGEAVSFDNNGITEAYSGVQTVDLAGFDDLVIGRLPVEPRGASAEQSHPLPGPSVSADRSGQPYLPAYVGYWIQVVRGPGIGQTRKITHVSWDAASSRALFRVYPAWDVIPVAGQTGVIVTRQYWQVYVVANLINQSAPTCTKSNLNNPRGGLISLYAPTIDSTVQSNRQYDTDGIAVAHAYNVNTPSCPQCPTSATFQTALDIRGNVIEGEYDWSSDCSDSGVRAVFGAAPTPEAPPPVTGFGVQFSHNVVEHADGLHGGAINIVPTWFTGPQPRTWRLIDNLIIAHNTLRDINGPAPANRCDRRQRGRPAINIEGPGNVFGTVFYNNVCERVGSILADTGRDTMRICSHEGAGTCECGAVPRPDHPARSNSPDDGLP